MESQGANISETLHKKIYWNKNYIILKLGTLKTIDHTKVMEVENPESTKSMGKKHYYCT